MGLGIIKTLCRILENCSQWVLLKYRILEVEMFQWMKIQGVYESLRGGSGLLKISENEEIRNEK